MKVQYLGDVNDYRKFGLLRLFMQIPGLKIGVCWLLTPDDRSNDGRKRQYLTKNVERENDTDLFNALAEIKQPLDMDEFKRFEGHEVLNGITFFNELTPNLRDDLRDATASKTRGNAPRSRKSMLPDFGMRVISLGDERLGLSCASSVEAPTFGQTYRLRIRGVGSDPSR